MAQKHIHEKTPFAWWLTRVRTKAKLTQAEAVERMKQLGKGVSVETWSRWESGVRPPPHTKIDALADTVGVRREVARSRAGYNVPLNPRRIKRASVIAAMLRMLSSNLKTDDKVLRIYALGSSYLNNMDPQFNIEEMQRTARLFDDLKKLSPAQRLEAWERVSQLFNEAKESPATNSPAAKATIIFQKHKSPVVTLGTRVSIEHLFYEAYMLDLHSVVTLGTRVSIEHPEELQSYVVKKIEEEDGKLVATIISTDS